LEKFLKTQNVFSKKDFYWLYWKGYVLVSVKDFRKTMKIQTLAHNGCQTYSSTWIYW